MSKIAITGEAWRENGAWKLTLKGVEWALVEVLAELTSSSRTIKLELQKAPEDGHSLLKCSTEKKA